MCCFFKDIYGPSCWSPQTSTFVEQRSNFELNFTVLQLLLVKKQPPEVFCKNSVLKNFTNFTGKHLCWSLFFNKVAGLFFKKETPAQVFS